MAILHSTTMYFSRNSRYGYWALCAGLFALLACRPIARPLQLAPSETVAPTASSTRQPVQATLLPPVTTASATLTLIPPSPSPIFTPLPTATDFVEYGAVAPGFSLRVVDSFYRPTSLAFAPDGTLYVGLAEGEIYQVTQAGKSLFAEGYATPLGLLWYADGLYVSCRGKVVKLQDLDGDGTAETEIEILPELPNGLHQNDNLAAGADGWIYMGIGSTCDDCSESDWRSAGILRFQPDGSAPEKVADGLRNPFGLAFNAAGQLFATENGRDKLGRYSPAEELNWIQPGKHYGWPECWQAEGDGEDIPPENVDLCASRTNALFLFPAHSSANGLAFYPTLPNGFPADYYDNAFVAVFGSYLHLEIQTGILRLQFTTDAAGNPSVKQSDWFLKLRNHDIEVESGRPLALAISPNGELFASDYESGHIYKIWYSGRGELP